MLKMKTCKCPGCGGLMLKPVGRAEKLGHDKCLKCQDVERGDWLAARRQNTSDKAGA